MLITNKPSTTNCKNNQAAFGFKISPAISGIKASEGHLNIQRTFDGKACGLIFTNFIDLSKYSLSTRKEIKLPKFVLNLLNTVTKPPRIAEGRRYF